MRIKNLQGFTLLEVLVSLTFITLISSSIYLMASFLISSTESISNNYLRKLSYKSFIERLKIHNDINNQNNIKIRSFSGDLTFSIRKTNTPNKKIYLLELMPNNSKENSVKSYWRKK